MSGALRRAVAVLAIIAAPLLSSCALVQLRDDARAFYATTVLTGRVDAPSGWHGPVVVAAVEALPDGTRRLAHHALLHEPGGYELIVPDGRYALQAFGDRNGNGRPDDGEPASPALTVDVSGQGILLQLDLGLALDGAAAARQSLPPGGAWPLPTHSTGAGALADLDAAAFSAESGHQGYWSPLETFRRVGGNVYVVEPYDPRRIPVLFVHGAVGSAQDWRAFVDRLDRTRYQAWLYQYPSGAPLDSMSNLLFWKLYNLQLRHRFERLHIVAHSMGGLVVRRMLLDRGAELPMLGAFVSLSTPWNGEDTAALGVKHSPAVVPSWRDMQPGQSFLTRLYERPLPAGVQHMLLFGHRGGYSLLRPNTDGTVTLASQLRPEAQAEARVVTGFDEDHASILAAPAVLAHVQGLLAATDRPGARVAGGRVTVDVSVPDGELPAGALPSLVLMPVTGPGDADPPRSMQVLSLSPNAGPTVVGPVAPGTYDASVITPAFRAKPARQRITVTADGALALQAVLRPQGTVFGTMAAVGDPLVQPAGSQRGPQATVAVRRIQLEGPGGTRVLVPRHSAAPEVLSAFVEGRDDADGAQFSFVGLPEGEHVLTVEADGHRPHASRLQVTPGRITPMVTVLLRKAP